MASRNRAGLAKAIARAHYQAIRPSKKRESLDAASCVRAQTMMACRHSWTRQLRRRLGRSQPQYALSVWPSAASSRELAAIERDAGRHAKMPVGRHLMMIVTLAFRRYSAIAACRCAAGWRNCRLGHTIAAYKDIFDAIEPLTDYRPTFARLPKKAAWRRRNRLVA